MRGERTFPRFHSESVAESEMGPRSPDSWSCSLTTMLPTHPHSPFSWLLNSYYHREKIGPVHIATHYADHHSTSQCRNRATAVFCFLVSIFAVIKQSTDPQPGHFLIVKAGVRGSNPPANWALTTQKRIPPQSLVHVYGSHIQYIFSTLMTASTGGVLVDSEGVTTILPI